MKKGIEEKRIIQTRGSYRISAAELRAVVRRPTIMTSVKAAQVSEKKEKKAKKGEGETRKKSIKPLKKTTTKKASK